MKRWTGNAIEIIVIRMLPKLRFRITNIRFDVNSSKTNRTWPKGATNKPETTRRLKWKKMTPMLMATLLKCRKLQTRLHICFHLPLWLRDNKC